MPFLAIILIFDIILGSFLLKIIKMYAFWQKPLSTKKKRPLPGSLQTVVRSGEAPPDGPFFKNWELANSEKTSMEINHQSTVRRNRY